MAYFQYLQDRKKRDSLHITLTILRFTSYLVLLLLLLNPGIKKESARIDKQQLIILQDRSRSMELENLDSKADSLIKIIADNQGLRERFELQVIGFDESVHLTDSLTRSANGTDISSSLQEILQANQSNQGVVIILTDGKQTYGDSYEYMEFSSEIPVLPVALGDTTRFADLSIDRVNSNPVAFLRNNFLLELFLRYDGAEPVSSRLNISMDGKRIRSQALQFFPDSPAKTVTVELSAQETGIRRIQMELQPIEGERNLLNNKAEIAVEVLDEKTRIALLSEGVHPDLGTMKKAVEANKQRQLDLLSPSEIPDLADYDLFILYEPGESFRLIHEQLVRGNMNRMTIAGPGTDWEYLNSVEDHLNYDLIDEGPEEAQAVLNPAFSRFDISGFDPSSFPPLSSQLGDILITSPSETLLEQEIRGIATGEPLLVAIGEEENRHILWLGSDLWRWRMTAFRNTGNFISFDNFMDKLIRYLSEGAGRDRLQIRYDPVYQEAGSAILSAIYLDEALEFDPDVSLHLQLKDSLGQLREMDMMLKNNSRYETDLSDLAPGDYNFTVSIVGSDISESGEFRILDRDLEGQVLRTPHEKLAALAENNNGSLYFPKNVDNLVNELQEDPGFSPVLRTQQNIVSLISIPWLLGLLVLSLAAEWFIRKYNGYN